MFHKVTKAFKAARAELHLIGISLSHGCDASEFRVNILGGVEATAYYTDDLGDAMATGREMSRSAREGRNV